jgi:hypothetical protein
LLDKLRNEFGGHLKGEIERIARSFAGRRGLAAYLHDELDGQIGSANLMSPRHISQLEIRKTRLSREWVERDEGPDIAWKSVLQGLDEQLEVWVQQALSRSYTKNESADYQQLDWESCKLTRRTRTQAQQNDLAEKATGIMAAVFPVASAVVGTATTAIGTTTAVTGLSGSTAAGAAAGAGISAATVLGAALAPVGLGIAAAGAYAWHRHRQQRKSSLELMREEEINALDDDSKRCAGGSRSARSQSGRTWSSTQRSEFLSTGTSCVRW